MLFTDISDLIILFFFFYKHNYLLFIGDSVIVRLYFISINLELVLILSEAFLKTRLTVALHRR